MKIEERIVFTNQEGRISAYSVNCPIVVQADSEEEMKSRMKRAIQMWINDLQKIVDNDNFEYVEKSI